MKLNEIPSRDLMTFNLKNWSSFNDVTKFLKKKGYKQIGSGVYAEAWALKSSNRIVKISIEQDQCWLDYVEWVLQQKNNPHLLKIHSVRKYQDAGRDFFIAVVEYLEPIDYKWVLAFLRDSFKSQDIIDMALAVWLYQSAWDDPMPALRRLIRQYNIHEIDIFDDSSPQGIINTLLDIFRQNTSLGKTVSKIEKRFANRTACFIDLHLDNIMQRKDGTLVVTDPVAPE